MLKWQRWIKGLSLAIGLLVLLICIIQVEKRYNQQTCKSVQVNIIPLAEQCFIDEKAMLTYLSSQVSFPLDNAPLRQIKTKELENIIKSHNFVQRCSVYKSWQGSLKITILPRAILARFIYPMEGDRYVDTTGKIVPLSAAYTPNVLLIESKKIYKINSSILDSSEGQSLLGILQLITKDPFWKAQITHISITQQNEVILSTQFSRHKIYFGQADNFKDKIKKLKLFYEVILPYKGWDTYKRINLKFDNQIVCE